MIDCALPEHHVVPVYAVRWDAPWPTTPDPPSIGSLAEMWIATLDEGFWPWIAEAGEWDRGRLDGFDSEWEETAAF